jgi:cell fate regulator YaaT (PSP1 superfamily)
MPKVGKMIDTPRGRGKVVQVNVITETVHVELENQLTVELSRDELAAVEEQSRRTKRRGRRR